MKVKFQADEDLKQAIVLATRRFEPAIDFYSAKNAGLQGLRDVEVLALCAQAGRVLVSHDQKTMPLHFAAFISTQDSPGLLIVPQTVPVSRAAEGLLLIWAASDAEEWVNQVSFINN